MNVASSAVRNMAMLSKYDWEGKRGRERASDSTSFTIRGAETYSINTVLASKFRQEQKQ